MNKEEYIPEKNGKYIDSNSKIFYFCHNLQS